MTSGRRWRPENRRQAADAAATRRSGPEHRAFSRPARSSPYDRLFDGIPNSYALDLVSSTASANGILELRYRRR